MIHNRTFVFSIISLALLMGIVIPGALIASSTQEFSFIETYKSPLPFLFNTALQALGLFVLWPVCIFLLFPRNVKNGLASLFTILSAIALVNTFLFPGDYGFITTTLVLSNPGTFLSDFKIIIINFIVLALIIGGFSFLLGTRRKGILFTIQSIILIALIGFGVFNTTKIYGEYSRLAHDEGSPDHSEILEPVYTLSKNGKNVCIVMLDRAISAFVPYLFAENPRIAGSFSGFTWYPNCVSFGRFTIFGAPPLFGGYEYTPLEIQKRDTEALVDKHNESLLLLPRIFADADFAVTVTDPSWANYSWKPDLRIYDNYPAIHAENIIGRYSSYWLRQHSDVKVVSVAGILQNNLIRFSVFKASPVICRTFIFDRGKWLAASALMNDINEGAGQLSLTTINEYAVLDYLPEITQVSDSSTNTFNFTVSQLTHDPAFFQAPDYVPALTITNKGESPFADEMHYHAAAAAFLLLGEWFDFMKANGVYDNTRIILVADHGWGIPIPDLGPDAVLPNKEALQTYNPLLMVKDFNTDGPLITDTAFMTNADVPLLALDGLVPDPVNPFTLKPLHTNKENGATITTSGRLHPTSHPAYTYKINADEWLHVHDNIFDPANWGKAEP
ncbi:hypothetical protein FACS189483_09810 [Spirochaetia bacterium]|nr:hypothetical protein FACS189483_09810 [Spirochaetia bacterium]